MVFAIFQGFLHNIVLENVVLLYYWHCFVGKGGALELLKKKIARIGRISLKSGLVQHILSRSVSLSLYYFGGQLMFAWYFKPLRHKIDVNEEIRIRNLYLKHRSLRPYGQTIKQLVKRLKFSWKMLYRLATSQNIACKTFLLASSTKCFENNECLMT